MSKSNAGRRERQLARKRPGRPRGSHTPLFADQQRFAVAAWVAFEPDFGPHVTAQLVTVLIEESTPIRIEDVEGLRLMIGAAFKPPTLKADLDDAARELQEKARLVMSRATDSELQWLSASASALRGLVSVFLRNDVPAMRRSLDILRRAGWGKVSMRIGRRLETALKSNFPPYEGPLSPAARRLLNTLRSASLP